MSYLADVNWFDSEWFRQLQAIATICGLIWFLVVLAINLKRVNSILDAIAVSFPWQWYLRSEIRVFEKQIANVPNLRQLIARCLRESYLMMVGLLVTSSAFLFRVGPQSYASWSGRIAVFLAVALWVTGITTAYLNFLRLGFSVMQLAKILDRAQIQFEREYVDRCKRYIEKYKGKLRSAPNADHRKG